MPLSGSNVKRTPDATGDNIKVFDDGSGNLIQAAALVDASAAHVGTTSNPLPISDAGGSLTIDATSLPLPSGAATSARQDLALTQLQAANAMCPAVYDYVALSYTGSNLTGVVFKTGGAGGTTVSTLTLAYSGSQLVSVTKT